MGFTFSLEDEVKSFIQLWGIRYQKRKGMKVQGEKKRYKTVILLSCKANFLEEKR